MFIFVPLDIGIHRQMKTRLFALACFSYTRNNRQIQRLLPLQILQSQLLLAVEFIQHALIQFLLEIPVSQPSFSAIHLQVMRERTSELSSTQQLHELQEPTHTPL